MTNSIAKDFKFFSLLRFALPTMVMMIFISLYTIIDGIFVSRFVGAEALSSTNIVYPVLNLLIAAGVMIASGGSAVIAKKLGEKKELEAKKDFSFFVLFGAFIGICIMILGNIFITPLVKALGATPILMNYCIDYLRISLFFAPACMLQLLFQTFFVTAGKPMVGLTLTITGGIANMILDYIFMVPMGMGIKGAALATGIGQFIPAVTGLLYFTFFHGSLHFVRPGFSWKVLKDSCINGSSEMVTNFSTAVVTYLFNMAMLKYLGETGVAAITIVLYGQFLFSAMYLGFSMGVAPVISYNYGRDHRVLLRRIFKICTRFIGISSVVITAIAFLSTSSIVQIFTPRETPTYAIARNGFFIFSINYIFAGINIYASSMFTAFSDGKISATISFIRTFVLLVFNILFLPVILGVTGIWLAVPFAEFTTAFLTLYFFHKKKHVYHYI